jgi:ADP-dependent phosphofructokinase/glucokinase
MFPPNQLHLSDLPSVLIHWLNGGAANRVALVQRSCALWERWKAEGKRMPGYRTVVALVEEGIEDQKIITKVEIKSYI